MIDKDIINALQCCVKVDCDSCPYSLEDCEQNLANDTINLIIHQKKQIHWLEIELKAMRGAANSYKAELERLKAFKSYFDELYGTGLDIANWHQNGDLEPFDNFYDSAIEEMVGEDR